MLEDDQRFLRYLWNLQRPIVREAGIELDSGAPSPQIIRRNDARSQVSLRTIEFSKKCCVTIDPELKRCKQMAQESREVRGRLPRDLKIAFEVACVRLETTQAAALEEAIRDWLVKKGFPTSDKGHG